MNSFDSSYPIGLPQQPHQSFDAPKIGCHRAGSIGILDLDYGFSALVADQMSLADASGPQGLLVYPIKDLRDWPQVPLQSLLYHFPSRGWGRILKLPELAAVGVRHHFGSDAQNLGDLDEHAPELLDDLSGVGSVLLMELHVSGCPVCLILAPKLRPGVVCHDGAGQDPKSHRSAGARLRGIDVSANSGSSGGSCTECVASVAADCPQP
mmetsp:Transcript_26312/g.57093  ORF Transcript_26312/g.57093 Transcript_26312/m.57093 type:complete len:209 (-) Transcript_26312:124-750(-)